MGTQLIFCVETNKQCKSDQIYIRDTIEKFFCYDNAMVKFSFIFMDGKYKYAWVVMVLLVVVGLGLLSISFLIPEEGWYQIASKAIEVIGSALISIGILDFVISLSNENELISRIQAGIDSKTDYSRYKADELQKIIKNASMAKVNEIYKTDTNKESRCKKLLTRYWECITSPTYLEKYYRDVEVVINENSMRITTQYDITCDWDHSGLCR